MPTDRIQLLGAGGHASVVIDAMLASGHPPELIDLWTQDQVSVDQQVLGIPVRHIARLDSISGLAFHICIGNNATRRSLQTTLVNELGGQPLTVIHPDASVSAHARIGAGAFIAARAVLAPRARLGMGTILNHGAVVDHDSCVGNFVHVAPSATLGGAVQVGDEVLVGAGATVLPSRSIVQGCTIGAGSVVVHSIEESGTYAGVPAMRLRQRTT